MKLEYEYSFEEFKAIGYSRNRKKGFYNLREFLYWALTAFNLSFGIAMFYIMLTNGNRVSSAAFILIAIGIGMIIWRLIIAPLSIRWYFKQSMLQGTKVQLEPTNASLKTMTNDATTTQKWSAIIDANEEPKHFVLWINKLQAYSIPKSCFSDEKQMQEFKELVATNVAKQDLINE